MKKMKRVVFSLTWMIALTLGLTIIVAEVPAQDVDSLRHLAEQGNADAQFILGQYSGMAGLRSGGRGRMHLDLNEAFRWYKLAAEQGHAGAQAELGESYRYGFGVQHNKQEAVRWWTLAAEQGHAGAQAELGNAYALEDDMPRDYEAALRWLRLATDQGDAEGQLILGILYGSGRGVNQDFQEAARWWTLAAEQGHRRAQYFMGITYERGWGARKDLRQALAWFMLAANGGSDDAQEAEDRVSSLVGAAGIGEATRLYAELSERIAANRLPK